MKKRTTSIQLHIPEPCSQDFSKMHPLPGGRFCGQCEKTVVDFRKMSNGQIAHIYEKRKGRVCGIFYGDQLNRELNAPYLSDRKYNWKAVAAFAASLFFGNMAEGQSCPPMEKIIVQKKSNNEIEGNKKYTITGCVTDEEGEPIPFASIAVVGTTYGTDADMDGNFILRIPIELSAKEIIASMVGYKNASWFFPKEKENIGPLHIQLKKGIKLPEVIVTTKNKLVVKGKLTGMATIYNKERKTKGSPKNEIENIEHNIDLSIFPNPFASHISLKINPEKAEAYLFHLYSESGQLVFAETRELEKGEHIIPFDFGNRDLPEGIYFLRISDNIGEIKTKRIVKVRP